MAADKGQVASGARRCGETGVSIPECSCVRCVEGLLRRLQPELLGGSVVPLPTQAPRSARPDGPDRLAA